MTLNPKYARQWMDDFICDVYQRGWHDCSEQLTKQAHDQDYIDSVVAGVLQDCGGIDLEDAVLEVLKRLGFGPAEELPA